MSIAIDSLNIERDSRFKLFHELMAWKVKQILLVSTPYDAWVLEQDCRLSERIVSEYKGLNLSQPPRLTWVRSAEEALSQLGRHRFELVLTMSHLADMAPAALGRQLKAQAPDLPVILLSHQMVVSPTFSGGALRQEGIDRVFVWSGDSDILVALVKSAEDRMNVQRDTRLAGIRVILFVQDSPYYRSSLLPILYREVVCQTQAVMQSGLNQEHRLLTMRARPKILVCDTYEEGLELFQQFEPYVLGVISDSEIARKDGASAGAGIDLLSRIHNERFDIPLLLTGTDQNGARRADAIGAVFVDKKSPFLRAAVQSFFKTHLGFGDFVFRMPDGQEISRASNLQRLAEGIQRLPADAFALHCQRNDFSRWLFARAEITLASRLRPLSSKDFPDLESQRRYLVEIIQARRRRRHQGVVANFDPTDFDPESEFLKIGTGSLGGKARGLAFMGSLLRHHALHRLHEKIAIRIPCTLVVTTDGFENFVSANRLDGLAKAQLPDRVIADRFLAGRLDGGLVAALRSYLEQVRYPLAVRSSGLLEDAQHYAYAGLYHTYLLPNDHPDLVKRLDHLLQAIKLVYASTYFEGPRAYANRIGHSTEAEKMAVIVQQLAGSLHGDYYYPAFSGVGLSHNYYPQGRMKPDDGIAAIALGLGKMVVAGEQSLRFCPSYPRMVPQRGNVDEILTYSQRSFYALRMGCQPTLGLDDGVTLVRRELSDAEDEWPVRMLASTYVPQDHRIRDTVLIPGQRVLTFASVLKHGLFPLCDILRKVLEAGEQGMGRPVEIEFCANPAFEDQQTSEFVLLQLRPMSARESSAAVTIETHEIEGAVCYSQMAVGNTWDRTLEDILYVKPDGFDVARTREMARQISGFNARLDEAGRKYLLVGPGRWGSADPWLGIPVAWADISNVGAIVETVAADLKAAPSQGTHFFHNLASLGIGYLCVSDRPPDRFDWPWLTAQPIHAQTELVAHVRLEKPLEIKVDGRTSRGLISFENRG